LEERSGAEEGEEFKPIRRGWCLGEEKFREELLTQMSERMGAETTMTVGWIAERMAMGTRGYLNHLLCRRRQLDGDCTKSRTDPFSFFLTPSFHFFLRLSPVGSADFLGRFQYPGLRACH
jgi:hypothetical protein